MGLLDRLQVELNRAGKVAQGALDEGRLRLEIFRVRQLADKAAQALGYAYYRAKSKGEELDPPTWDRLSATLRDHEAEATRLNAELARVRTSDSPPTDGTSDPAAAPAAESPAASEASTATSTGPSPESASGV